MLRVTSPSGIDLPKLHDFASNLFSDTFASGPQPFTHPEDHLVDALALARELELEDSVSGVRHDKHTITHLVP